MSQNLAAQVVVREPGNVAIWPINDTVANLAAVTASGYLAPLQLAGNVFVTGDLFYINYVGGSGMFSVNVNVSTNVALLTPLVGTPLVASVALTAAQFNGMYAAPVQLVAAPGAGNLILPGQMILDMSYGSAAFAGGGVVAAQWGSAAHGAGVLATNTEAAADFFATASTVFSFLPTSGNTVGALPTASVANAGLYLSNATGAFTTGTGSSFVVKVWYQVVAV
jgi:hypothetical protein